MSVVGVVLGAGESSRFGSPKQLLPFGDTTLLGQVVRNANASSLDGVVVVLGRASGEVREALCLLLGDQPGVLPGFVDRALSEWKRERSWAAVCSYRGRLGHPFIFSREAFDDLKGLHGDKAVWKLIEAYPDRVRKIEIDAGLPPDVDTPEDYERVLIHQREAS